MPLGHLHFFSLKEAGSLQEGRPVSSLSTVGKCKVSPSVVIKLVSHFASKEKTISSSKSIPFWVLDTLPRGWEPGCLEAWVPTQHLCFLTVRLWVIHLISLCRSFLSVK